MTLVRPPFAIGFYPGEPDRCDAMLDQLCDVALPDDLPAAPLGGLVPHAGWVYSGPTASHLWSALARAEQPPEVLVLLGAVHVRGVCRPTVYAGDAWQSPGGAVPVDRTLADAIVKAGDELVGAGTAEHDGEHSLEVQVPFIARLLPDVPIVPIAVPADGRAVQLGARIAAAAKADGRRVAVVASSDLTHYGARYGFAPAGGGEAGLAWSRDNDDRLVERALAFDATRVLEEAAARHSACGAGALAACITATRLLGAREATLLHQTTSYDVRPVGPPDLTVGYASILYA